MEAIAIRLEAINKKLYTSIIILETKASRLEDIAIRLEAIVTSNKKLYISNKGF